MEQVTTKGSEWTMAGELDCQPQDAVSTAGIAVCRMRLVRFPEAAGEKAARVVLYTSGQLAERCRDALGEGDLIEASGWMPSHQRPGAVHPEVLLPDTPGAVKLRARASQLAGAARGARKAPSQQGRIVHCLHADYDVYIGRGRDPHTQRFGQWGNRYSSRPSRIPGVVKVRTSEEAIERFRLDLWARIRSGDVSLQALAALDGKTLGCWHEDPADAWRSELEGGPREGEPCHGHVLIDAAAWAKGQVRLRALHGA